MFSPYLCSVWTHGMTMIFCHHPVKIYGMDGNCSELYTSLPMRGRTQHVARASWISQAWPSNWRTMWLRPHERCTEMDGGSMLLHRGAVELLGIAVPTNQQWWNLKSTPCTLELVSMAMGIGAKSTDLPTSTHTTQYWVLDQRGSQCQWIPEVDQGLCLHPPAVSWSISRPPLDHRGLKHDPQSK